MGPIKCLTQLGTCKHFPFPNFKLADDIILKNQFNHKCYTQATLISLKAQTLLAEKVKFQIKSISIN